MRIENYIRTEVTSADVPSMLNDLTQANITVKNIKFVDAMTVRFDLRYTDYSSISANMNEHGHKIQVLNKFGMQVAVKKILQRPVLMIFIVFIIILAFFLPTRVLFIEIEGTSTISSNYVREKASECGIRFGASRQEVRSEVMKNKLITAIPELHWAGVNTFGCVAVVTVEEKYTANEIQDDTDQVNSIVAALDGVITSCTVQRGTPLCTVGEAVKEGQVLISGYTDCGILIQATQAEAEVIANTMHQLHVLTPLKWQVRNGQTMKYKRFSLQIGKKLINFSQDSGICGSTCVKMYSVKHLTLPGGYMLPLAVRIEEHTHYSCLHEQNITEAETIKLEELAEDYLTDRMSAGKILDTRTKSIFTNDNYQMLGIYYCTENIGRVKYEGRVDNYG